jgi:hypothetical protein
VVSRPKARDQAGRDENCRLRPARKTARFCHGGQRDRRVQREDAGLSVHLDRIAIGELANAYTQSAMAELVRVRSIELANHGAQLKFNAAHTSTLHNNGTQVLQQGAH